MLDISNKVEEIAFHLGKPWKINGLPPHCAGRCEIIDGSGRSIFFRLEKDKFRIYGSFSGFGRRLYRIKHTAIGISANRPAKVIAADIKRRLLPDYLKNYELAVAECAKEKQREEIKTLITQAFIKVSGGYFAAHASRVYFDKGEAEIQYCDKVTLTLRDLSPDQAIRIIGMLKEEETE